MNFIHIKYAVEVAKTRSINKAAEVLYVGQSALSRAIKELEASIGVTLFERSAKGMTLTADGEVFIKYAQGLLDQVNELEHMFGKGANDVKKKLSIAAPRATYIADALAKFSRKLPKDARIEVFYKETNSQQAIKDLTDGDYKLCVLRYAQNYDKYYRAMLEDKNLTYEPLAQFKYVLLMNEKCPLATKERITSDDLRDLIEIAHADPYVPTLPLAEVKREELTDISPRKIFVFERASQFELFAQNPDIYMWVSPIPEELRSRYGLIQRTCDENERVYQDVLVHSKNYTLTDLDRSFIEQLEESKRAAIGPYQINA